jgi:uncharacterized protein with PQ loop repeat
VIQRLKFHSETGFTTHLRPLGIKDYAERSGAEMWKCFWEFVVGAGFLRYGLTRKPLDFTPANPVKQAMPVYLARLIYLPIGIAITLLAIRDAMKLLSLR